MTAAEVEETLRRSALFDGVPAPVISAAAACGEPVVLAIHDRLLTAGLPNARLFVVVSGSLNARTSGTAAALVRIGAGECAGELSLLQNGAASADVTADQASVLVAFDRAALWSLIDRSPDLARNLLRLLAGRDRFPAIADADAIHARPAEPQATIDSLTGLRTRLWMDEAFARQIERTSRAAQPSSILLIDIDHFTSLQTDRGSLVADAVLCRIANVLAATLRPQDLVARSGHAQFAVLLPALDASASIAVAERLRRTVELSRDGTDDAGLPKMTVSIGGTTRRPFEPLPDLVKRAEAALQRAREAGRNRSSE